MSIPIHTTTIRVLRPDPSDEPYVTPGTATEVAFGVRAHISTSQGQEITLGGAQEVVTFRLSCDPVEIHHLDQIEDETTGDIYEVEWARSRVGFGMEHTEAALKQVSGSVAFFGLGAGRGNA